MIESRKQQLKQRANVRVQVLKWGITDPKMMDEKLYNKREEMPHIYQGGMIWIQEKEAFICMEMLMSIVVEES